ncbi:type VI-D CRISPR-associated RNA-guided ribonuclease Cas13d [uncultured Ruminococcus sp.]|nr:type VI-D CRISPR-associated RNA-guided ribonuclease Cas13d [uncultured Ruminococcus sp.]
MAKKKRMSAKERKQQQINLRIKKATEDSTKKVNTTVAVNNKPISKEIKKSKAKLAGVKWVIKANDDVAYISSFGKGNNSVLEKRIIGDVSSDVNKDSHMYVNPKYTKKNYEIKNGFSSGSSLTTHPNKPDKNSGMDALCLKTYFEKEIFKDKFNDNMHIQAIYNIFDIEKTLAKHITNIIYAVNSLDRSYIQSGNDTIGFGLNFNIPYAEYGGGKDSNGKPENKSAWEKRESFIKFYNNAKDRFGYFESVFYQNGKQISEEKFYIYLNILNFVRNSTFHYNNTSSHLYKERYCKINPKNNLKTDFEFVSYLNEFVKNKFKNVNKNFISNEKNNLYIILNAYGEDIEDVEVVKKYSKELYKLSVLKTNKNLGVNVKKLRESAIEYGYCPLPYDKEKEVAKLSSIKHKLYKTYDFVITHYLNSNDKLLLEIVEALRLSKNDDKKENVYKIYAEKIFKAEYVINPIKTISNLFAEKGDKLFNEKVSISEEYVEDIRIDKNIHNFTKVIFFLTCFLDGKEINDLLTNIISKLQVIEDHNNVIKAIANNNDAVYKDYSDKYAVFKNSGKIATELEAIKSIARMENKINKAFKEPLLKDAMLALGVSPNDLDEKYEKYFKTDVDADKDHQKVSTFLMNNVINNSRFKYVVKYINPADINRLAKNKHLVKFVLDQIPHKQIDSYYNSVSTVEEPSYKGKIQLLTKKITGLNFYSLFENCKIPNVEKEKKKAVITLYFTIIYILVKNLVNINGLYTLALYFVERDGFFYKKICEKKDKKKTNKDVDYLLLPEIFSGSKYREETKNLKLPKEKDREIMKKYLPNDEDRKEYNKFFKQYRNNIVHLNIIANLSKLTSTIDKEINSYFEIFHYCAQRVMFDYCKNNNKVVL